LYIMLFLPLLQISSDHLSARSTMNKLLKHLQRLHFLNSVGNISKHCSETQSALRKLYL